MTGHGVIDVAERVVRTGLESTTIESVVVREDDDWAGEPSLFVDVFLSPDAWPLDDDASIRVRRSLSRELLASGERRFAYLRFRDREGEEESDLGPEPT